MATNYTRMIIMDNNIKSISKVCLIMLISIGTLLYINYISIFAEDKQQQQQQQPSPQQQGNKSSGPLEKIGEKITDVFK